MSSNLHYNILNTKTVLRKDTILKIITNTLLIATLFSSNIIASQVCAGDTCLASFAKPVAYKSSTKSFTSTPVEVITPTIINEPSFQLEPESISEENIYNIPFVDNLQNEIVTVEPIITNQIEEVSHRELLVDTPYEDSIQPLIVNHATEIQSIDTILFEETMFEATVSVELICQQGEEEVITCDIQNQEECVCV